MTSEWLLCPECREGEFLLFVCLFIYISWRLITLQYRSGFCHTLMWISHGFTCVPHPEPLSHLPPHPIPLGHLSAPALSTCLMRPARTGDVSHLIIYMFQCFSEGEFLLFLYYVLGFPPGAQLQDPSAQAGGLNSHQLCEQCLWIRGFSGWARAVLPSWSWRRSLVVSNSLRPPGL